MTTVTFSDTQPNLYNGTYYTNYQVGVTVTLTSEENTIYYTTDGSEPDETSSFFVSSGSLPAYTDQGTHTIRYFAKNAQGLIEEKRTLILVLDFTPPTAPGMTVTSPTNVTTQTIGGTKDADTAIYLQGATVPIVALNSDATWSYDYALTEGINQIVVFARDAAGNDSTTTQASIVLDTMRPSTSGHDPERNTTVPQPLNKQVIVHIQDVLSLIGKLSENNTVGEETARMFGEYRKIHQKKTQEQI